MGSPKRITKAILQTHYCTENVYASIYISCACSKAYILIFKQIKIINFKDK